MGNITIVLANPIFDDAVMCHDCCILQKRSFLQTSEVKQKIDEWVKDEKHHKIVMPINPEIPFEPMVTFTRTYFSPDWPVPACWMHLGPGPVKVVIGEMPKGIEPIGAIPKGLLGVSKKG